MKAGVNLSATTGMVLAGLVKVGTAGMVAIGEGDGDSDEEAFLHGLARAGFRHGAVHLVQGSKAESW